VKTVRYDPNLLTLMLPGWQVLPKPKPKKKPKRRKSK
jgi:hypothetical protein